MARPNYFARRHVASTYRSGLEEKVSKQLEDAGINFQYEAYRIPYVVPASKHTYRPDFILPNGIIIETKGIWDSTDRQKHKLIREQYPDLDIRLVFSSSRSKLYKGSPTSYADYCIKNGYQFADKLIPVAWLKEPARKIPEGVLIPVKGGK